MTLKEQNKLLIETLIAVRPLIGRGFIMMGTTMMGGITAIESALSKTGHGSKKEERPS